MKRFRNLLALVIALTLAMEATAATPVIYRWYRAGGRSSGVVKLAKMADAEADPDNITGVWSTVDSCYAFTSDQTNFSKIDFSSFYQIYDAGAAVVTLIDIGAKGMNDTLRTHRLATTGVHGADGAVVGTTDTLTLTNKTMDGDDNTFRDVSGLGLKLGTTIRSFIWRPDTSNDAMMHFDGYTTKGLVVQVSNAAKTTDKVLTLICDSLDLQDDAGNDAVISGVTTGSLGNTAVSKTTFDALEARVDALERDDAFSGGVAMELALWRADARNAWVHASWATSPVSDMDSVKRFEVYIADGVLSGISAGSTSDAELEYLRANARRTVMNTGEFGAFGRMSWMTWSSQWVVVVAEDWAGTVINSDVKSVGAVADPRRDEAAVSVVQRRQVWSLSMIGETTADSSADAFEIWEQATTTARVKARGAFKKHAEDLTLTLSFFAKAGTAVGEYGYVKVALLDGATEDAAGVYRIDYAGGAYPATPQTISIDLTALDDEQVYGIEVSVWSAASYSTFLKQQIVGEVVSETTGY